MDKKNYHAYRGLKKIPNLLDFEVLMSRLGVSESFFTFIRSLENGSSSEWLMRRRP